MTKYAFNKIIDRRNTDCLKYDFAIQRGRPADVLPFWVADMDFPIAREIQEALVERCQHAIFGYSESTEAYFHAVRDWSGILSILTGAPKQNGSPKLPA